MLRLFLNQLLTHLFQKNKLFYFPAYFVSCIYSVLQNLRLKLYNWHLLKSHKLSVPVIVVGNVVIGGAGKTPVVMALVQHLLHLGYYPGVISRGYGRKNNQCQLVLDSSKADEVGDEPLLIADLCRVPVAVGANRIKAGLTLLKAHPKCNVIVSDDGLQHLALKRDVEIVIFDERGLGNNRLLPAGLLREPWPRQPRCRAHFVLNNIPRELANYGVNATGKHQALSELHQYQLHAIAGIAKPSIFFEMLCNKGLSLTSRRAYPDHHNFLDLDLSKENHQNSNIMWLCTEKDAIKLWQIYPKLGHKILAVPLLIQLDSHFLSIFDATINALTQSKTHG